MIDIKKQNNFLLKNIKGTISCIKENGIEYTIKRILFHLKVRKDNDPYKNHIKGIKNDTFYLNASTKKYTKELKKWYKSKTKKKLNIKNPVTFNEKIQWMKIYDSTSVKTMLSDKYIVREWIKEKIGEEYLIPLLGVWDNFEDIDFNKLPNQFVLKANHGSGWNIIVRDKSLLNIEEMKKVFKRWMNTNYAFVNGFELQYKDIKRKIIAEEYINPGSKESIDDYKFYCFCGEPKYIQIISNRDFETHKAYEMHYDINWNKGDYLYHTYDFASSDFKKPAKFDEMIGISRKLSKEFSFVRVDLYYENNKIYFGEMTFTPGSGIGKWTNEEINKRAGQLIGLKANNIMRKL